MLNFPASDRLTEREKSVISELLLTGHGNLELAKTHGVTRSAICQILTKVYQKLGLRTLIEIFPYYAYLIPQPTEVKEIVVTYPESAIAPLLILPTQEISKKVFLSVPTVEDYISRLYRKCGVRSRREFLCKRSHFRLVVESSVVGSKR